MKSEMVFISGGAGFIGSNLAKFHIEKGDFVVVYDNLSRKGTELNLRWLKDISRRTDNFQFVKGDVRNLSEIKKVVNNFDIIYHMAAQVAVTTSIENPRYDFEVNALGTFNMLEATRVKCPNAVFIYSSTNKVYGDLSSYRYKESKTRYEFSDRKLSKGVTEKQNLDFHSPYGCSKGTGDQYVKDYHRIYGLKTVVFRQSCIYGNRQFGNEDQGWVMHFIREILLKRELTIYGDGKQVRDILNVDDLISAYILALDNIEQVSGEVFNIGGGSKNTLSLIELISFLEKELGYKIHYKFTKWREGDQKIFISDNSFIEKELGWKTKINKVQGVKNLVTWARSII